MKNPNPHWKQAVPEASICITQQMCHTFLHDFSMVKDERKKYLMPFFFSKHQQSTVLWLNSDSFNLWTINCYNSFKHKFFTDMRMRNGMESKRHEAPPLI